MIFICWYIDPGEIVSFILKMSIFVCVWDSINWSINRSIGVREGVETEYNVVITNSSDVRLSTNESNYICKFYVLIVVNIPNNV